MRSGIAVCCSMLVLLSHPVGAQETGARAFAIEAAGATAGSLLGFGVVYLARDSCGVEDLGCTIKKAGLGIGLSTVGAAAGNHMAGRLGGTNPSGWGAALGRFWARPPAWERGTSSQRSWMSRTARQPRSPFTP